jgi:hypothetical protein
LKLFARRERSSLLCLLAGLTNGKNGTVDLKGSLSFSRKPFSQQTFGRFACA